MNKSIRIVVIFIMFLLLFGCKSTKNDIVDDNKKVETPVSTSDVIGMYYGEIYYYDDETNELKEYYQYTDFASIILGDNNSCDILNDTSELLFKKSPINNCEWSIINNEINLLYEFSDGIQRSIKGNYKDNSFYFETKIYDDGYKWNLDDHKINGIKFIKMNDNYFHTYLEVNKDLVLKEHEGLSRYAFEVNKHNDLKDLFTVHEGFIVDYEGNVNFNKVGLYPIKLNLANDKNETSSKNIVISIVPSREEQQAWYDKHYVLHDVSPDADTSDRYWVVKNKNTYSVCVDLYSPFNTVLILKNGIKCEDYYNITYDFSSMYNSSQYIVGKFVTFETITDRTSTLKEIYKYKMDNKIE